MTKLNTADASAVAPTSREAASEDQIRPFRAHVPDADVADLGRRLAATRWPTKELVGDRSQGVQLATLRELARYWTTEYDWRKARRGSTRCRSSRPRSTGSRSTSSTSGRGMRMRCR